MDTYTMLLGVKNELKIQKLKRIKDTYKYYIVHFFFRKAHLRVYIPPELMKMTLDGADFYNKFFNK